MSKDTINPYVQFYGEHKISPVHQDLANLKVHLSRREKLYRLLGLTPAMFNNKKVIEVGPGGGYNGLALLLWGANLDFVEPNPTAQSELQQLMNDYQISDLQWKLYPLLIEDFPADQLYDIVLAEGFIPGLYDRTKVMIKLKSLVKPGGVVVVTCFDELSVFF